MQASRTKTQGFTLPELLICIAILGEIATFTIPKIVTSQQNARYNAEAKEVFSMVSGTYQLYRSSNTVTANTSVGNLTSYMNYISADTSTYVDWPVGWGAQFQCGSIGSTCYRLHNGGILFFWSGVAFGGTNTTNAIDFYFDPDGSGSNNSLRFFLYVNGRITDYGNILSSTTRYDGTLQTDNPSASAIPSWFSY